VTHDFEEATAIAAKIFICIEGRIHQQGMADEIIKNPSSNAVRHLTQRQSFS
jgi:ABC-type proline/glycine betaine transport system ATPase subunit